MFTQYNSHEPLKVEGKCLVLYENKKREVHEFIQEISRLKLNAKRSRL